MILHRIEEIAKWSPDADNITQTKKHQSKWLLAASPDGLWTVLIQDDAALLWNDKDSYEIQLGQVVHEHVVWSFDSQYFAIAQADGRVNVVQVSSAQICYCVLEQKRPVRQMLIIDPAAYAGSVYQDTRYKYELLLFMDDGSVRSYLFQHMERFTIAVRIGSSYQQKGSDISFQHSFNLRPINRIAFLNGFLVLGGTGISIVKLIPVEPHFDFVVPEDVVNSSKAKKSSAVVQMDQLNDQLLVLWSDGLLMQLNVHSEGTTINDLVVQQWNMDAMQVLWWDSHSFVVLSHDGTLDVQSMDDQMSLLEGAEKLPPLTMICKQQSKKLVILELIQQFAICKVRNVKGVINAQVTEISDIDNLAAPISLVMKLKTWLVDKIRPLSYVVNAITGVHLVDDVDTTTKEFSVPLRTYTLKELTESSPQNLLQSKLEASAFDEALVIASKYSLTKDQVYKEHWKQTEVSQQSIAKILALVSHKDWQIKQCMEKVCCTSAAQKLLYNHGLSVTDLQAEITEGVFGSTPNDKLSKVRLTDGQVLIIRQRQLLLELLTRLEVFVKLQDLLILEDQSFEIIYKEFCQLDMFDFCQYNAYRSQFVILDVLLTYYSFSGQQTLQILDAISEVSASKVYETYWKLATSQSKATSNDWSHLPNIQHQTGTEQAYVQPDIAIFKDWLHQRAYDIDNRCGSLELSCTLEPDNLLTKSLHAFMFDSICQEYNVSAVELPEKLSLLSVEAFTKLTLQARTEMLLSRGIHVWQTRGIPEVFVSDMLRHVIPNGANDQNVLEQQLKLTLCDELELAITLLKAAINRQEDQNNLLARVIADCCMTCHKDNMYEYIQEFYDIASKLKGAVDRQKLYDIESIISVAEELDGFGITFRPEVLLKLPVDVSQQKKVLTRLSRLPCLPERQGNSFLTKDLDGINELLESMVHIQEVSCPAVSIEEVELLLLQSLLSSESFRLIDIARQMLFPAKKDTFYHQFQLNQEDIEALLVSVAQGYFDNAQNGNMKTGLLQFSVMVLDLPPKDVSLPKRDKLKDYITAASELYEIHSLKSDNGELMLPLEIKLEQNVVAMLCRACQSSSNLYQDPSLIARYYKVLTDNNISKHDIDMIIFVGALENEDFELADRQLETLQSVELTRKFIQSIKSDVQRKRAHEQILACSQQDIIELAMLLPEPPTQKLKYTLI